MDTIEYIGLVGRANILVLTPGNLKDDDILVVNKKVLITKKINFFDGTKNKKQFEKNEKKMKKTSFFTKVAEPLTQEPNYEPPTFEEIFDDSPPESYNDSVPSPPSHSPPHSGQDSPQQQIYEEQFVSDEMESNEEMPEQRRISESEQGFHESNEQVISEDPDSVNAEIITNEPFQAEIAPKNVPIETVDPVEGTIPQETGENQQTVAKLIDLDSVMGDVEEDYDDDSFVPESSFVTESSVPPNNVTFFEYVIDFSSAATIFPKGDYESGRIRTEADMLLFLKTDSKDLESQTFLITSKIFSKNKRILIDMFKNIGTKFILDPISEYYGNIDYETEMINVFFNEIKPNCEIIYSSYDEIYNYTYIPLADQKKFLNGRVELTDDIRHRVQSLPYYVAFETKTVPEGISTMEPVIKTDDKVFYVNPETINCTGFVTNSAIIDVNYDVYLIGTFTESVLRAFVGVNEIIDINLGTRRYNSVCLAGKGYPHFPDMRGNLYFMELD